MLGVLNLCYAHTDRDDWVIFLVQYKVQELEIKQKRKAQAVKSLAVTFIHRAMMPAVSFE